MKIGNTNFHIMKTRKDEYWITGNVCALPEPLVDRCEEIRKYSFLARNLMGAIL